MPERDRTSLHADDSALDRLWHAHQRRMLDIAVRVLVDLGDAEDAVQEAFSRLARTDISAIDDPEAWLVVVTTRLCVDRLRAHRRHPTEPFDTPDSASSFDPKAIDPADQVALVDNVTLAMTIVLERLSPAERTSFVLHDVFQYSFDEVATAVGRSPAACRQLASRARRTLRAEAAFGRFPVDVALHRQVSERFIAASAGGDVDALLALLDPDVEGGSDMVPGVVVGATEVAAGILRHLGPPAPPTLLHLPIGDRAGIIALRDRRAIALVLLTIEDGLVAHVHALSGPTPRAAVTTVLGLR